MDHRLRFRLPRLAVLCGALLLAGCAASPYEDRFEHINRPIRSFNDGLDRVVTRPLAQGYVAITPEIVRDGISNFFVNLRYPLVPVNQLLQGKPGLAASDTGRFLVNSTLGVAGIFDPATGMGLPRHQEDFGQTFGVWGFPMGDYIVLPLWGGVTTRELIGNVFGVYMYAPTYLNAAGHRAAVVGLDLVNVRSQLLGSEDLITGDRYIFLRDSWLQRREFLTNDGRIEDPFLDDDF